jgi:hypothetical protein
MKCNDFDEHIDEMLSGILHPDANQHMRQCERCTSHFRARTAVQNGLRSLAAVSASGPSRATDRAVMDAYRQLQQGRAARESESVPQSAPLPAARNLHLLQFPHRGPAPAGGSRPVSRAWGSGVAAAAVVLAVLGSGVHLWNGVSTVNAPSVAPAAVASAPQSGISAGSPTADRDRSAVAANLGQRRSLLRQNQSASQPGTGQVTMASLNTHSVNAAGTPSGAASATLASAPVQPMLAVNASNGAMPETAAPSPNSIMHLASSVAASNVAQSASSTWPGYSNLMYCDPVVCSGPMQVVHIKVPVGEVKPNLGQSVGNGFVNAEVVIGPDGVARAIRVAN